MTKPAEATNFNICNVLPWLPQCNPSPSPSATPTATPTEEPTATPNPCDEDQCEPTETPYPTSTPCETETPASTEQPTVPTTEAGVPESPRCEYPTWAPSVSYHGRSETGGFLYSWTTVKEGVHTYIVWFGITPNALLWNTIVTGESIDIHMFQGTTNWMKVAALDNGCVGPFSEILN